MTKEFHAPRATFNGDFNLDNADHTADRHVLDRHEGYDLGSPYVEPSPMFFSRLSHPIWIGDLFRDQSLFIIGSGPSFKDVNHDLLKQPGIMTMAVNNAPKTFRPDLWLSADDPPSFLKSIWVDPKITKFARFDHAEKFIFDSMTWRMTQRRVADCPNVYFWKANDHFQPKQFLTENSINWGNIANRCVGCGWQRPEKKECKANGIPFIKKCPNCQSDLFGCRSVMLPTLRVAYHLGFKNIYLLGVDFNMTHNMKSGYHFQQKRASGAVKNNNNTYRALQLRFDILKPIFDEAGFNIFNCNPDSALTSFPHMKFEDAIKRALVGFPDWKNERTEGLYDRKANEKAAAKEASKKASLPPQRSNIIQMPNTIQTFADFARLKT